MWEKKSSEFRYYDLTSQYEARIEPIEIQFYSLSVACFFLIHNIRIMLDRGTTGRMCVDLTQREEVFFKKNIVSISLTWRPHTVDHNKRVANRYWHDVGKRRRDWMPCSLKWLDLFKTIFWNDFITGYMVMVMWWIF